MNSQVFLCARLLFDQGRFLVCLLFCLFFVQPALGADTPEFCLGEIQEAIDTGDTSSFQQLVDLDSVIDDAFMTFLKEAKKPDNAGKLSPLATMIILQADKKDKNGETLRELMRGEAKAFMLNGVASGSFAGRKLNNQERKFGILAPLLANASMGRKEIRDMGDPLVDGDAYILPFIVYDYGADEDYAVVGKFRHVNGKLRLVSIMNLEQLFSRFIQESM